MPRVPGHRQLHAPGRGLAPDGSAMRPLARQSHDTPPAHAQHTTPLHPPTPLVVGWLRWRACARKGTPRGGEGRRGPVTWRRGCAKPDRRRGGEASRGVVVGGGGGGEKAGRREGRVTICKGAEGMPRATGSGRQAHCAASGAVRQSRGAGMSAAPCTRRRPCPAAAWKIHDTECKCSAGRLAHTLKRRIVH